MDERLRWLKDHAPIILMAAEDETDWVICPETDATLISTQDIAQCLRILRSLTPVDEASSSICRKGNVLDDLHLEMIS